MNKEQLNKHFETERMVLGQMIVYKEKAPQGIIKLKTNNVFLFPKHQFVFEAMVSLQKDNVMPDMITVSERIDQIYQPQQIKAVFKEENTFYYVSTLMNEVGAYALDFERHCKIILDRYTLQQTSIIAAEIQQQCKDQNQPEDIFGYANKELTHLQNHNHTKGAKKVGLVAIDSIAKIEAASKQKGLSGISSGLTEVDKILHGFQDSDLIILAARPGMGKTALALKYAKTASINQAPVALFSLEMSEIQLTNRLISSESGVSSEKIKKGDLSANEWNQVHQAQENLNQMDLYIDDTPGITDLELINKARMYKNTYGIGMIIVDYIQLMKGSGKHQTRENEISSISRSLKLIAKELNIPVIALSQLSRAVETRGGDKKPLLSDLRESGAIEQDADIVMFVYRAEYYGIQEDIEGNPTKNKAEVIIAKHRNGSSGTADVKFTPWLMDFTDLKPTDYADYADTAMTPNLEEWPE